MKPDANALRQRRHDLCMELCACPKCNAPAGMPCCSNPIPDSQVAHLGGLAWGKTLLSTQILLAQLASLRKIGGLHKERWAEFENLDVVVRLALLADEPRF